MSDSVEEIMAEAREAVLGILTARCHEDIKATSYMIKSYLDEAIDQGHPPCEAWSRLFSGAIMLMLPMINCQASHHETDLDGALAELGMMLAHTRDGHD